MAKTHDTYVLTIDAGTGSGRALVFDGAANQVAVAQREWTHPSIENVPGSAVFDTDTAWDLICQCIHEVLATAGIGADGIRAVTAASLREGMVLYDQDRRAIWACPNIDARAGDEALELIESGMARRIYDTGGDWLSIISPPRFRWIARHEPELFERVKHMSMISDWVLACLSGQIVTDPSCGSSAGLFDLRTANWSDQLIGGLELPEAIFPPVRRPGTVLGEVTNAAASQTGLARGTPVIVGGADTQLALLGSGGVRAAQLTVVGGTFWQTAWLSDRPLFDPKRRLRTLCHVLDGLWMTEGIGFLNGLGMRWVRDTVCDAAAQSAAVSGSDPYSAMESLAESVPPGADGVFAMVSDVMNARKWVQAPTSFLGLDVTNPHHSGDRGKGLLVRAMQESAAFTALGHYEILRELSDRPALQMTFCGGASKGRLWPQIMADVFDMPVRVPVVSEATSLGAALCALVGIGVQPSLAAAAEELVRWDRTVEPIAANVTAYEPVVRRARDLQRGLIEWVGAGRLDAMWRGAGTG
jgi:autoinducer 2 (AI-2) kinase